MVHVCVAMTLSAAVPFQRATVTWSWPAVESVNLVQVVASIGSCDAGAPVAVVNCCSSKVGLTMCT